LIFDEITDKRYVGSFFMAHGVHDDRYTMNVG